MNNDIYAEWLVKRKRPAYVPLVYIAMGIGVLIGLMACMLNQFGFVVLLAVIFGIYFVNMRMSVEYEYVFVTNELTIDRIYSQRSRKKAAVVEMSKVEKVVSTKSHEYDFVKNNPKLKVVDYSSGKADAQTYGILYGGEQGQVVYIFEPNEKLLKCMKNVAPRKVIIEQAIAASR